MRRALVLIAVVAACKSSKPDSAPPPETAPAERPERGFPLGEATIDDLQKQMASGERSAAEITRLYLERIEAIDRDGPTLRAVIEVNPNALADARALDRERAEKGPRGPLHGIPILVKDNIATAAASGMETTAGSLALVGFRPESDSFVVERLRAAGAVILGKANLSEWANFRGKKSTSGWSARGGQVRNPYVLDRNPCGSSSGSGVAVSANLAAAAIGTETDGSIVCPSSANGIVGIEPTVGLVSRTGIIPISASQDTAGPMTRSVADAAIVLSAIAGYDASDSATAELKSTPPTDYADFEPNALAGARIGAARDLFGEDREINKLMDSAIAAMRAAGATVIDVELAVPPELSAAELEILLHEVNAGMKEYLSGLPARAPKSIAALVEFNLANAGTELEHFDQEWFIEANLRGGLDSPIYTGAVATARLLSRDEGINRVMREHRLDALIAPTGSPAWPTDLINGDHFVLGSSTFAAVAGYPNISVPAGFIGGLPVGISFFGGAWSEARLIAIAADFEAKTRARLPPRFVPTLDP